MKLARRTAFLFATGAMGGALLAGDMGLFVPSFIVWLCAAVLNSSDSVGGHGGRR